MIASTITSTATLDGTIGKGICTLNCSSSMKPSACPSRASNLFATYLTAEESVILIGMPGMEKRLSRYPQLYSRVGFAHHYRPLQGDELSFVLTRHWRKFGLTLDELDFTDTQAIASIARITGANFRLLHRLFVQIERIMKINGLSVITDDVVEAARSTLVIGTT